MKKVDLDGIEIELEDATAEKLIASRQAQKDKLRTLESQVQAIAAREAEAKAAAEKAAQEAEVAKLANKGEYEAALKKREESHSTTISKLKGNLKASSLRAAISQAAGILPEAVDDVQALIASGCDYDLESGSLVVLGADGRARQDDEGKQITVDAWIAEALAKRPHFRKATSAPGSGAGHGKPTTGLHIKTITLDEYSARMRDPAQSITTAREIAAGKLKITE